MASSYTTNKVIEKPGNGDYVDTWNVPVNGDMDVIDQAFGGTTSLNVTSLSGTTVLTTAQYRSLGLAVSGVLTANVAFQIPSGVGGQWIVNNQTTGGFALSISSGGGGTSVAVTQGVRSIVFSDGTNIALADDRARSEFPSGTSVLFVQTAAPTGWTKSTTHNNKALRVVSGTASSGGSVDFTTAFAAQAVSGTVGNTTLTVDQIPAHTHGYTYYRGPTQGETTSAANLANTAITGTTTSTGGGQSHTHTFTGTAINLAVAYVDVIICVKD